MGGAASSSPDPVSPSLQRSPLKDEHLGFTNTVGKSSPTSRQAPCLAGQPTRLAAHVNDSTSPQNPENARIDHVISILREIKKSASPDELIVLQKALMPSSNDIITPDAVDPESENKKSSRPAVLIRRSSCLTPGIATREQTPKTQPTSPQSPQPRRKAWSRDMFGQSPLSKLAGWESKNNGQSERAVSPDISHLGAHELGSLRVTNGAASPAPSMHSALQSPPLHPIVNREDDYFTASEGSGRDSVDMSAVSPGRSPGSDTTPTQIQSPGVDAWTSVPEFQLPSADRSANSDSRPSTQSSSVDTSSNSSLTRATSVLRPYQREVNSNPFLADSVDPQASVSLLDLSEPRIPSAALYMAEASSNPFLPLSSGDAATSEDYFKVPDSSQQDKSPAWLDPMNNQEVVSNIAQYLCAANRANTYDTLNGNPLHDGRWTAASSIYSLGSRKEKDDRSDRPKTDSGYHSESSLRTFNEKTHTHELSNIPLTVLNESHTNEPSNVSRTTLNESQVMKSGYAGPNTGLTKSGRNRAENKRRPASTPNRIAGAPLTKPLPPDPPILGRIQLETPPVVEAPSHTPTSLSLLTKALSSPVKTPHPVDETAFTRVQSSPITSPTSDSKQDRSRPKKLQKKNRPLAVRLNTEPLIVQSQKQVEPNLSPLPSVPVDVSSRHAQRMNEQPDMEYLEKTFKSVGHCGSRDSCSSFQPFNLDFIQFPSAPSSPDRGGPQSRGRGGRRSSLGIERPWRHMFRSKSRTREDEMDSTQAWTLAPDADFGTVTSSLGSSPYDFTAQGIRPRFYGPAGVRHPHQMSSNLPRSKSAIGMSDQAASEFARLRSRDRLEKYDTTPTDSTLRGSQNHASDNQNARKSIPRASGPNYEPEPTGSPIRESTIRRKPVPAYRPVGEQDRDAALMGSYQSYVDKEQSRDMSNSPNQTLPSEDPTSWETSAREWRLRRKSIGENLRQSPNNFEPADGEERRSARSRYRPQTPHSRSAPQTPARSGRPTTWQPGDRSRQQPQTNRQKSKRNDFPYDMHSKTPARAASPTPSVLERAAAFENSFGRESPPRKKPPTRRPPSPPKPSPNSNRTPRSWSPPKSKFCASDAVTPSGVVSAYTSYDAYSVPNSQMQSHEIAQLMAPRRRAWPTSAFQASQY